MYNENYLIHYGKIGMKWGTRQQQNDFSNLKKSVKESMSAGRDFTKSKRYQTFQPVKGDPKTSSMLIYNKKLLDITREKEKKTDILINQLKVKYGNVSLIPDYNRKTGEAFVEIYMAGHHETLYEHELG